MSIVRSASAINWMKETSFDQPDSIPIRPPAEGKKHSELSESISDALYMTIT